MGVRQVSEEVEFPKGVTWKLEGGALKVKGPKGELTRAFVHPLVRLEADSGKLFIKASPAVVDGQEFFNDKGREDSVKDLKERAGNFVVVGSEKEADYLLVVVERSKNGDKVAEIKATISYKENGQWKPGARLTGNSYSWSMAARRVSISPLQWGRAPRSAEIRPLRRE